MPTDFRLTTSNPSFGMAPLPSSQIGQYVNQQLGGGGSNSEALRNMYQRPMGPTTRDSASVQPVAASPVETGISDMASQINASNKRIAQYQQAAARKKAAQPAATGTQTGARDAYQTVNSNGVYIGTGAASTAGLKAGRSKVISLANSYLGSPYVFAGNSYQGIDCSGLVQQVYRQLGFNLPRLAAQQRDTIPGVRTNNINSLRPGDIVAWTDGSHIAIYAGNGQIIQAANPSQGVIRSTLTAQTGYYPGMVIGIKLNLPGD